MSNEQFGDFQTSQGLANQIVRLINSWISPKTIIEPTVGKGSLLIKAINTFKEVDKVIAWDINESYVNDVKKLLHDFSFQKEIEVKDIFQVNWADYQQLKQPILIIGNPPWVTNTSISKLNGNNLPMKFNQEKQSGITALMGESNFDISESIIWNLIKQFEGRRFLLCMICKKSVIIRIIKRLYTEGIFVDIKFYMINSKVEFQANVEAGIFVLNSQDIQNENKIRVFNDIVDQKIISELHYIDDFLIYDIKQYHTYRDYLQGTGFKWRSGVKHDLSNLFELVKYGNGFVNKYKTYVEIEQDFVYPYLKSSDVYNQRIPTKYIPIPQKKLNEKLPELEQIAPKLWNYLFEHRELFKNRKSRVYQKLPEFSIFGIGDYTFKPWKVAISSMYKEIKFHIIEPYDGKPVLVDDTVYFLGFDTENEAKLVYQKLNSDFARKALQTIVNTSDQRKIKIKILHKLTIERLPSK
jgi:hypothetical protein